MKKLIAAVALCAASSVYADESPFRFGAHVSGGSFQPHEIDGPSDAGTGASFGVIGVYDMGRSGRLYSTLSRTMYKTSATDVMVGQSAKELEGSLSYQSMWRLSRSIRPWVGAGIGYVKSSYSDRHTMVSAGSPYSNILPDASKSAAIGILSINFESSGEGSEWVPGLQIQGGKAFSGKAAYVRVGLYFLY